MVEFALVAPIFFAAMVGLVMAVMYVFEVQVANQAAQAAARWAVVVSNYSSTTNAPQCGGTAPSGMVTAARAAAGPYAASITTTTLGDYAVTGPASLGSPTGCRITVSLPFSGSGGFFFGPPTIVATAVDYVE